MVKTLLEFIKSWQKLRLHQLSMVLATAFILIILPGQNDYQILQLKPQSPPVKSLPFTMPLLNDYPVRSGNPAPFLSAAAAIVIDVDSAVIMYQKNPDMQLMPASTTKIITALVALETYKLDQVLTVKEADESIGHSMHLVKGETITVENLLYGILVESGNDAALALAQGYDGGYQQFVNRMNAKAKDLHAQHTTFRNVSGVEQFNHVTTVRDLGIIARYAMQNPTFARMVATKSITVKSADGALTHELNNINELLGVVPGIRGIKTGWTENAGECLVTITTREILLTNSTTGKSDLPKVTKSIITVILGSNDRFGESKELIEWAFANHTWEKIEI